MAALTQEDRDALYVRQTEALEAQVQLLTKHVAAGERLAAAAERHPTADQQQKLELYRVHLDQRLRGQTITTGVGDSVIKDAVRDAAMMTTEAWEVQGLGTFLGYAPPPPPAA